MAAARVQAGGWLVEENDARVADPTSDGSVQPEYVVVPDALLAKTQELKRFFDLSYAYVASLKPKPAPKKKLAAPKKNPPR